MADNRPFIGEEFAKAIERLHVVPGDQRRIVRATVLEIDGNYAPVRFGADCRASLPLRSGLAVGDEVEILVEGTGNADGWFVASESAVERQRNWLALEAAYRNGRSVVGIITDMIGGGFSVRIGLFNAFLPQSQLDITHLSPEETRSLIGAKSEFQILKLGHERDFVVSRRAIRENENLARRAAAIAALRVGEIRTGTVKAVVDYGVFVDIGGVDGLLHVTDISWDKRFGHPSELYAPGQRVDVVVMKVVAETARISLSVKALLPDPWDSAEARYKPNSEHDGEITNIVEYGVFIAFEPGVEALLHSKAMSHLLNGMTPREAFTPGQTLRATIQLVDREQRRIYLSNVSLVVSVRSPRPCDAHSNADCDWIGVDSVRLI